FDLSETGIITNQTRVDDSDIGVGFAGGVLYEPVAAVSIGLTVFRRPSFSVSEDFQLNSGSERGEAGPLVSRPEFPKAISLDVPDQVSAGVAWRPHARVRVALDAAYVRYSDL